MTARMTPTLASVLPAQHTAGTTITVTGSGFGSDASLVRVDVEGCTCEVQAIVDTSITCYLESAEAARQKFIRVFVEGKGKL